ncbi:ras GEF [Hyphopichia burtonii NRRL Y-1933]|uniref:Ras GEF n=1 Tax=Hyphopichia burtonii NRRL Y-1933 TaxID=984485 RepID=A0A1E4RGH3_9ASCO|nr:ras GEF [Hyphopichia burtonii NRRL Y-1933]ODV66311.1 ras GEF [Hyphopichia burtonii NRRL Y-1933]
MSYMDEIPPDVISPNEVIDSKNEDNQTKAKSIKSVDMVVAIYDFPGTQHTHLPLNMGDTVSILAKSDSGWWDGVIVTSKNEYLRGWIPSNYVRSVNYVQPVLNQLKNNKEIDSITAANTAANVLIPSFNNILQKNLFDLERNSPSNSVRKNSVVSFASSETSIPSDSKINKDQKDSTASQSQLQVSHTTDNTPTASFSAPSIASSDNTPFVSTSDAEKLASEYKLSNHRNIVWLPRLSGSGDVVFFSEILNVYCESCPMSPYMPDVDEDEDDEKLDLPSKLAMNDNPIINHDLEFNNDNDNDQQQQQQHGQNQSGQNPKNFDPLKRDSTSSLHSQSSGQSSYHHFNQPFFAIPGLFYSHTNDLMYWTQLKERFNYLLDLSFKALKDHNKQLFSTHFTKLTKVISIIASASRLIQNDFINTKYENSIRRKLKRIAGAYSQIYINGILHLSYMHYSQEASNAELFSFDISKLNKSTSLPNSTLQSTSSSFSTIRQNSNDNNDDGNDITYLNHIQIELEILRLNINSITKIFLKLTKDKKIKKSDYDGSDASDDDSGEDRYNVLPQVYPRFITNEFNGGNWCNPFFATKNSALNASGDDLKNRYHLKNIIDKDAYDSIKKSTDEMTKLSKETLEFLNPDVQHKYYNDDLKNERNTQILRLIYKYLYHAGVTIDLIESFDFTVFCLIKRYASNENMEFEKNDDTKNDGNNPQRSTSGSNLNFDYPIVLEFFHYKQQFHDLISNIVMATQTLTVQDPDVFRGMKDDDPLFYNRDILKIPIERASLLVSNILSNQTSQNKGGSISLNPDELMSNILLDGTKFFESILNIIQQLIDERETILNYATRVMHDDFNVQLLLIERNNTILSEKSEDGHLYYTSKKSNDIPWYLEGDDEYDLLLDVKGNIKGGTKEALIAHLTHHDLFDSNFNTAFILTFPTMMKIGEFINLLINRFNIEAPEGLSYEEYNTWISKKQNPIRLRVMNIMKLLIEKHWCNSYYNEYVLKRWLKFAQTSAVQSFSIGKVLSNNLTKLLNGEVICKDREPSTPDSKTPAPLTKGFLLKRIKLLDIDYIELARQLTLREFSLYAKITKLACISKVWGKKSGLKENIEPITNFIKASNQLTNYVGYMILRKEDPRRRVQVIRYFVQVAEKCRQLNNFSSMTAIISALYSSPIHRLKKTWKYVSTDTMAHLQNMNKLMNSSRNFNEYRDVLKFVGSESCIPFFGVYLSDLTFVYHGNTDHLLNRPRMLNFAKRAKTSEIVLGIDRFKSTAYNLQVVPEIQKYLDQWFEKSPTNEKQYEISLTLEPREQPQNTDANNASSRNSKIFRSVV